MLRSDKLIQTLGLPCDSYVSLVNAMSPLRTSVSYGRWCSFLKIAVTMTRCLTLGEHTGEMAAVFTATAVPGAGWSPSQACPDVSLLDRARGPLRSSPGPQVSRTLSLSLCLLFPLTSDPTSARFILSTQFSLLLTGKMKTARQNLFPFLFLLLQLCPLLLSIFSQCHKGKLSSLSPINATALGHGAEPR